MDEEEIDAISGYLHPDTFAYIVSVIDYIRRKNVTINDIQGIIAAENYSDVRILFNRGIGVKPRGRVVLKSIKSIEACEYTLMYAIKHMGFVVSDYDSTFSEVRNKNSGSSIRTPTSRQRSSRGDDFSDPLIRNTLALIAGFDDDCLLVYTINETNQLEWELITHESVTALLNPRLFIFDITEEEQVKKEGCYIM